MQDLKLKLGINTGFATNRFPEPEVWMKIVGKDLGLHYIQHVADHLDPRLPDYLLKDLVKRINKLGKKYKVSVDTTFLSAFTRVNQLLHPDKRFRELWLGLMKKFFYYSGQMGARGSGGHFGIISVSDFNNRKRREFIMKEGIEGWQRLSDYGKKAGFKFLIFEPMSIPRECAETIYETKKLLKKVNANASIPILLCLDVDHGDLQSKNPDDTDPYAWIRELGALSPIIHIKQSTKNKSGHWPFTKEYNKLGIVTPEKVIQAIRQSGLKDAVLTFEFAFRERYPAEYKVISSLKESVAYWRKYIKE